MRRVALKIASSRVEDQDDRAAMTDALNRLYGAATQNAYDIVENLSPSERAKLAVFCYGRAHLNTVGLAIAATCDLDHLAAATHSSTAGRTIYMQSREVPAPERSVPGRRPITLATAVYQPTPAMLADLPA